jgi:hypothetical protein
MLVAVSVDGQKNYNLSGTTYLFLSSSGEVVDDEKKKMLVGVKSTLTYL